jgi:hypothetical protein
VTLECYPTSRPFLSPLESTHTQGLLSQGGGADVNIQHPPPNLGRSPSLPMTTARHKEGSLHGTLPHRAPVLLLRPALGPRSSVKHMHIHHTKQRPSTSQPRRWIHTQWLNICDFSLPLPFPTSPNAQQAVEFAKPILRSHLWTLLYNITVNGCLVDHQQPNTHNTQPVHPHSVSAYIYHRVY